MVDQLERTTQKKKKSVILLMKMLYFKTPLNKYTFKSKVIKNWVESHCNDKYVLNLFAGITKISGCLEVRNDMDKTMNADYSIDALDFVKEWNGKLFDIVVLDSPYSYRKLMEFYNGHKASRFNQLKDLIPNIIVSNGAVITFGYQSVSMGIVRGFEQREVLLMSHGGAIHDTIAVLEQSMHRCYTKPNSLLKQGA